MKKVVACLVCCMIFLGLAACSPVLEKYEGIISELRSNAYEVSLGDMAVKCITGVREEPFQIDGFSGDKQKFTVITLEPASYEPKTKYKYKIMLAGVEYEGDFLKHPYNNTYSAEILENTDATRVPFSLYINGTEHALELVSVRGDDFITAEKALEIALKKLKGSIRTFKSNNVKYEIFVRLRENPINSSGGYYWYVAFVGENEITYAALIDPVSLSIVAIRD